MSTELWEILNRQAVLQHPNVTVELEEVRLPNQEIIAEWPKIYTSDYVTVLAVNALREALVVEAYRHGLGRSSWQLANAPLLPGEDPSDAAVRTLCETGGYAGDQWRHLGSFVIDADAHMGVGHFFIANKVTRVEGPLTKTAADHLVHWIALPDLKRALWDGRVGGISDATTISMGLMALASCYGDLV